MAKANKDAILVKSDDVGDYIDDGLRQNLVGERLASSMTINEDASMSRPYDESNRLESQDELKDDNAELIPEMVVPTTNLHALSKALDASTQQVRILRKNQRNSTGMNFLTPIDESLKDNIADDKNEKIPILTQ